jgi:hypothetical protein
MNFDAFEAKFKNFDDKVVLKRHEINQLYEQDVIKLK